LAGKKRLTRKEMTGLNLFTGKAKCANCHVLSEGPGGEPPLFTDFTYDNIGVPRNPDNPWYSMPADLNPEGINWIDPGLGGFLATRIEYAQFADENYGKHKVPTLRNVDKQRGRNFVKAFGHNGYFKSLKNIVHFYNTRDIKSACPDIFTREIDALAMNCWPVPEITANLNTDEMGNLGLTDKEEDAIVAFLKTLSDSSIDSDR
jgi:cytochrome c peroxidase